jgi:hypothetical protein
MFTVFFSCKKADTSIGANSINPNDLLNSIQVDTFSLKSYTKIEDSVVTDNPVSALLGSYNDPVFGTFKAGFFTQLRLPAVNPSFGDINTIEIDSFVLGLQYSGFYGSSNSQKIEVYELLDSLGLNTTYYSFSDKLHSSTNLIVPSKSTVTPDPVSQIVIDTTHVKAQLRLFLDTNLARKFLNEAVNNPSTFSSNENFLNYFKGLYIGVNNGYQSINEGGIMYFDLYDPLSKLTIYYKQAGTKKTYDFLINTSCANFNKVDVDYSGTNISNAFENSAFGQSEFYAQALKSRGVIKLPGISKLSKKSIIHEAQLLLPVDYETGSKLTPGTEISVATKLEKAKGLFTVAVGVYDATSKHFVVDLKPYIQGILSSQRYPVYSESGAYNALIEGVEIYITPKLFNTSADRIIFNGTNTINKNKPKLTLKYTEF